MVLELECHNLCEIVNMQNVWFYMKCDKKQRFLETDFFYLFTALLHSPQGLHYSPHSSSHLL